MKTAARTLVALLVALAPGAPAAAFVMEPGDLPSLGLPGTAQAGDIQHVASVAYTGGSDIEFATKTVTVLDENGDPVCVRDEAGACVTDENGNVVYQTEERDYAFVGRLREPVGIIDITDPRSPVKVAEIPCRLYQNDVQVAGDVLIMAADGAATPCILPDGTSSNILGFATADISDPRFPVYLGSSPVVTEGGHNTTVHPTQPIVYVSSSASGTAAIIHIFDISDPANPTLVKDWNYFARRAPHDITFSADGKRAYAASGSHTDIINTEDPRNPSLVTAIAHPNISLAHQADPTPDGDYLLVTDELGGGSATTASPGGGVHVFDIRDEANPAYVGAFWIDTLVKSGENLGISTSHVFRINPDGYTLAIAWYNDGVHVIDFSDIKGLAIGGSGPTAGGAKTIGSMKLPSANTWAAKMWQERHPGYVFANDINRGFDVFYVPTLAAEGLIGVGSIRQGHRANYIGGVGVTRSEWEDECDFRPQTNGLDGWVSEIPAYASAVEGEYELFAKARNASVTRDLDVYFYDGSCGFLGADEDATTDEQALIPEGSRYVMVTNYQEGQHVQLMLTVALAPPPEEEPPEG